MVAGNCGSQRGGDLGEVARVGDGVLEYPVDDVGRREGDGGYKVEGGTRANAGASRVGLTGFNSSSDDGRISKDMCGGEAGEAGEAGENGRLVEHLGGCGCVR